MKKILSLTLFLLAIFAARSQEGFGSIDMMLLEKAPLTTHAYMDSLAVSTSPDSRVVKMSNASGGDTFFMYHQEKLGMTINFSKDRKVVSAMVPSLRIGDIETELVQKKFKKKTLKPLKNATGDVLKRYQWSKKDYPYKFITYDHYQGIELLTDLSDEY